MTEKINGPGLRPTDTLATRRSEAARAEAAQGRAQTKGTDQASTHTDTVSITQSGLLMSRLEEAVQRAPIVRSERVAAIKDAIAAGTYEIDDQRTADKLVEFERDMPR